MLIRNHPHRVPRTAMEVFEMLPEGTLCQVIDNIIYMSPGPTYEHQRLIITIAAKIDRFVVTAALGECTPAPVDVFLDQRNAFQPDIVFILKKNLFIVSDGKIKGVPDIVIEIMSPGSKEYDLGKKKTIYERKGVKEYFAVEQKSKEVYTFYLKADKYEIRPKVNGKIVSRLLKKTFRF